MLIMQQALTNGLLHIENSTFPFSQSVRFMQRVGGRERERERERGSVQLPVGLSVVMTETEKGTLVGYVIIAEM